jgi:hypothetical protein
MGAGRIGARRLRDLRQPDEVRRAVQPRAPGRSRRRFDNADSDQPAPVPAVQTSAYSLDVEILQRKLDRLGYHDVGDMDGNKGAIVAFLNDRHISAGEITGITPVITDAISAALAEGWARPTTATAQDIAPKVEAVRQSLWQRLVAKVTGASAGGVALVTGVGSQFGAVNNQLSPIKEFFANVPGWAWFALIAFAALAVWLSANKTTVATVADYNTGKIN